ncbi:hypothetical protein KKG83_04775 [Candidatus Micrarchaeota archaeon]|nr:hypothetical protein [Candidatus Micrarchaeota archaeon]
MSLTALTFGKKKNSFSASAVIQITRPSDLIVSHSNEENSAKVIKSCFFFQQNEPYILANVVSGVVSEKMYGVIDGKKFEIVELESKYGYEGIAKKGMTIGLIVKGLEREIIESGTTILFEEKK